MLRIYINETEYERAETNFQISDKIGNVTSSDIGVLVEPGMQVPRAGDMVEIIEDSTMERVFWGICGIPKSPAFSTGNEPRLYRITCGNANSILGRRIVNVAYQGYTVTEIIQRYFENYISMEGIALGLISDIDVEIEIYTAANYNLQVALDELAELVGATWQITTDREFYFVAEADFPKFPRVIDMDFLLGTDLQETTNGRKLRTVQYIAGATDITDTQEEKFNYTGDQQTFVTSFALIREPEIFVNGVQVPPALVGINGIDDNNPNILFSFSFASQVISYKGDDFLAAGDEVKIVYVGQFPIRIAAYNDEKIQEIAEHTGTSGFIEDVYIASNVKTSADANQLAQSLIAQFENVTSELKWWMRSDQLRELGAANGLELDIDSVRVLMQMSFNLPEFGIVGDYVIVERRLTLISPEVDNFEDGVRIDLKLANRDYLKSYAQVLSDLRRNVNQLMIRNEDVVVQSSYVVERKGLAEDVQTGEGTAHRPVATITNGAAFAPSAFDFSFLPTPSGEFSGALANNEPRYPTVATDGALFAPLDIGGVYPI